MESLPQRWKTSRSQLYHFRVRYFPTTPPRWLECAQGSFSRLPDSLSFQIRVRPKAGKEPLPGFSLSQQKDERVIPRRVQQLPSASAVRKLFKGSKGQGHSGDILHRAQRVSEQNDKQKVLGGSGEPKGRGRESLISLPAMPMCSAY